MFRLSFPSIIMLRLAYSGPNVNTIGNRLILESGFLFTPFYFPTSPVHWDRETYRPWSAGLIDRVKHGDSSILIPRLDKPFLMLQHTNRQLMWDGMADMQ
jgi:hypothetical protein